MKDLKSTFDPAELRVLNMTFSILKYGIDDEYKFLKCISSAIFKKLFDDIHFEVITYVNCKSLKNAQIPTNEYIENQPFSFEILQNLVYECIKMYKNADEGNWSEWSEDAKRKMIINLASPYLIKEQAIDNLLETYQNS